jgi:hypothetical protein
MRLAIRSHGQRKSMKVRILLGGLFVALLLAGCATPEQRYVHEYEAKLKQSFGDYSTRYDRYSTVAKHERDGHASDRAARDS